MSLIENIISAHRDREGALLPILHDVQAEFGCVSEDHIRTISKALNLTRAEVHGVVSFYHDFRKAKVDQPVLKICRAEACQARGGEQLIDGAAQAAANRVKLEPIYCLGLCSAGPAAMDEAGQLHARLDQDKLNTLIKSLA